MTASTHEERGMGRTKRQYVERPTGVTKTINGILFSCWAVGIGKHEFRNDALTGRAWLLRNRKLTGWYAGVDSDFIMTGQKLKLFRKFDMAALAALKLRETRS